MPSLRQLLAAHAPLLLLDAASARVQAGWLAADGGARWATSDEEAGVGIFRCMSELSANPASAGALVFCDGPGSVLGIRTSAMAVRTWHVLKPRAIFSYHSLAVVAAALQRPDLTIIADARRGSWHCLNQRTALRRAPAAELTGALVMPAGFRHWTPLPAGVGSTPYSLAELLPRVMDEELFRSTDSPEAFLHEEPSYVTWAPQIHRAPGP